MPFARSKRGTLAAVLSAAVAVTGFQLALAPTAQAASTDLVINEVYLNGGSAGATYTNKYVELRNLTNAPVSLSGMSVQYRASGSTGASTGNVALSGSVDAGGYFVLVGASNGANGGAVPHQGQQSGGFNPAGGSGTVTLVTGTTAVDPSTSSAVVDKLGYGSSNTPEGGGAGPTGNSVTSVLGRTGPSTDTDVNSADFAAQDPTPGTANPGAGPAGLAVTNPGTTFVTLGEPLDPLTLAATGGTAPYTWSATGLPDGVTIATDGTVSGTPNSAGTSSVTATVTDGATPPATASTTFDITVVDTSQVTAIADVQGTGATTPLDGQTITTEGVVTAAYPTGGLNGFYLQTPGEDTTPDASDGIFVYGGASGFTTYPAIGDSVKVTGAAGEFSGQTQITTTTANVSVLAESLGDVDPKTAVPGTDCALPGDSCLTGAALDAAREVVESEAFQPTADYTATDVYDGSAYTGSSNSSSNFGEIGLAASSSRPLVSPTEVIDAQATAEIAARKAYNDAHRIILDDASSTNYTTAANTGSPLPWLTATHSVRVGASVTFPAPVIFTYGFSTWRMVATSQVVGAPSDSQPQIAQTRADNLAPQDVGGDVRLATFNVLNFFPTTGEDYVASGLGTCTYYTDREGNRVTVNNCGDGPRGAADDANLTRQRGKIVSAIDGSGADVVSLEELENSVKFGKDRDFAITELVTALNADAGAGTWAFVPSPAATDLPPVDQQDVIRNGFIYQPAAVELVGDPVVLADQSAPGGAFADAREPLAQAFKQAGTPDAGAFAVIVNHFKSKGSGDPDPDGQGNATNQRVAQANSLVDFADDFTTTRGVARVFLVGDFNAYSQEDPIQVLTAAGYTNLDSTSDPEEESYNFDGQVGSLDHVLANEAALADVNAVDVWPINADESVYYEYSRFNYNVTDLYADGPFRSSDHNPEVVGINVAADDAVKPIQILATNDFHGRIANDPFSAAAGAGVLAGAVKQLRTENPDTVFAAAGDLIGASTFESFIANDKPTIDALNSAGLEVSAVGNHEFDQGYDDLVNRVMAPYDATTNPDGGAAWKYLGANVKFKDDGSDALDGTWIKTMDGVDVGFIGAVTEHLPELVSPAGIADIEVTDIVEATNTAADDLKAEGADVIVMLVHEGAPSTDCTTMGNDPTSDFGSIINGVNDNVDAIVSGHTHLAYNCSFPVAGWDGRVVTERPVVSAGQYGSNLNQIVFDVDSSTGEITGKDQAILALKPAATGTEANYPVDQPTQDIVDAAVANADVLGAQPLGQVAAPFQRGYFAGGTTENRGAESTLGNLVAEVQRWATETPTAGSAQIAFMNPGGLRADLLGTTGADPADARTVTYKQAATVQPFANTLVNLSMTGEQIKAALEQQWQPAGSSRPFLRLGTSAGFVYTYDPSAAQGSRVTSMVLGDEPVSATETYKVTVNSFLAAGGDNFGAFNVAPGLKQDTGQTDLQAMVDYLDEFANVDDGDDPLPVDASQRSVGVTFPAGAPETYGPGLDVAFGVSSFSMTNENDPKDSEVVVKSGDTTLGTFPLDNAPQAGTSGGFDEVGTAEVSVTLPDLPEGPAELTLVGATTGTEVQVPITIEAVELDPATVTVDDVAVSSGGNARIKVEVSGTAPTPSGTVEVRDGDTVIGTITLARGKGVLVIPGRTFAPGSYELTAAYSGDSTHGAAEATFTLTVAKVKPSIQSTDATYSYGQSRSLRVRLSGLGGYEPTGTIVVTENGAVVTSQVVAGAVTVVPLPAQGLTVGRHDLVVVYSGNSTFAAAATTATASVSKDSTSLAASVTPSSVPRDQSVALDVVVSNANGIPVTGRIEIAVSGGSTRRVSLVDGRALVNLGSFATTGKRTVTVTFLGTAVLARSSTTTSFRVVR